MRIRDRLIAAVIAAAIVCAAVWLLLVSPERAQVSDLTTQITTAQTQLTSAQSALAAARATAAGYVDDVHALTQVTTAIPPTAAEPGLVSTITKLAGTQVDFHALQVAGNDGSATGPLSLGLTFTFKATYGSLQNLLTAIDRLTSTDGRNVAASGRLVTIDSIALSPDPPNRMTATVTAHAYSQAPPSVGATADTGALQTTSTPTVPTP